MTPIDLFPLEDGEQLVDAGNYQYRANGELTSIGEPWCRHQHRVYGVVTRALRTDGVHFLLAVKQYRDGEANVVQLLWQTLGEQAVTVVTEYRVIDGELRWRRDRGEWQQQGLAEGVLFFPLIRVFTGEIINGLLERGGRGSVLVPSIVNPADTASLFEPLLSERFAEPAIDAEVLADCSSFRYGGAQYGDGALFWLDGDGLLQRYEWQQSEDSRWQVTLADHQLSG